MSAEPVRSLERPTPLPALKSGYSSPTSEELDVLGRIVKAVGETEFVPKQFRGRPGACLAAILYGRALGLDLMVALAETNVIEGKPSLSATAVLGRIRSAGHSVRFEEGTSQCVAFGRRADTGDTHAALFTVEDAQRAGLVGKDNWKKYPRAMLRSRATTELARALFSDVFAGLSVYTAEELGDATSFEESPPVVDSAPERLPSGGDETPPAPAASVGDPAGRAESEPA